MRIFILLAVLCLSLMSRFAPGLLAVELDLSRLTVPRDAILGGGPPKDGIPALTHPRIAPADRAGHLDASDRVLGVEVGGQARAYPIDILTHHEAVNDRLGGRPIAVTYCPLTDSGVVYSAELGGKPVDFGISGLLYNSNVLLYDRQSGSLWSQLASSAVSGKWSGTGLAELPSLDTTWGAWRRRHPDSTVLSRTTGHVRDYDRDPYASYRRSPEVMFPAGPRDSRLPAKSKVLGLTVDGRAKAYPLSELSGPTRTFEDTLGGRKLLIHWDTEGRSASASRPDGTRLASTTTYWFAWSAFHPGTELYRSRQSD